MTMRAHRAHRLGDRADQLVIERFNTVVAAQPGRLGGFDVAAHRLAVHSAMPGDRAQPR